MTVVPLRAEFEVRALPLGQIRHDPRTQPRNHIDHEVAERYRDALLEGDEFPPITCFFDGTDYWNADGWHRVLAHKLADRTEILCEVRPGTLRDAEWHSFSVNGKHGYQRSDTDVKRILNRIFADPEWCDLPMSRIAGHVGCAKSWVWEIRERALYNGEVRKRDRSPTSFGTERSGYGSTETQPSVPEPEWRQTHIEEFCGPSPYQRQPDEDAFPELAEVFGPPRRACATCRHIEFNSAFRRFSCRVFGTETAPESSEGYSCIDWEFDPDIRPDLENMVAECDRDAKFAFKAFPPEHAKPAGRIRYLIEQLYQELDLSPADAARASPWKWARPELREQSAAVSQWLSQFAKELEP